MSYNGMDFPYLFVHRGSSITARPFCNVALTGLSLRTKHSYLRFMSTHTMNKKASSRTHIKAQNIMKRDRESSGTHNNLGTNHNKHYKQHYLLSYHSSINTFSLSHYSFNLKKCLKNLG